MTLLSRILGFIRDMVFARMFGVDGTTDAFFLAFKIPNFLRRLFAEGAFSQAFIPVLSEYKEKKSAENLTELVDRVAGTLGVILFVITLIGVIAAPILIMAFGPGFASDPEKHQLASDMLRFTFPYLFFIAMTAFAGSILNSFNKFAVPAFTPVLLNLSLIGMALWVAPLLDTPIMALAWGVFLAGLVQLLFQLPFLHHINLLPRPKWGWRFAGVQRIIQLMLPAIFGSSVAQINLLLDTVIASFLVTGSITWLYYADRLVEFPLGIFGIALATVILPHLSKNHAQASPEKFSATLDWALRLIVVAGIPATLGLFILAKPMLTTLFYGGEFAVHDIEMASLSLMAYSTGLMGFILVKILVPGFYARQDTKTPVRIGIIAMVSNMVLNLLFVAPLVMFDFPGPHMGLALATACSAFINAALLLAALKKKHIYRPAPGWEKLLLRVFVANTIMGLILWFGTEPLSVWTQWETWLRALHLMKWIAIGAVSYFTCLTILGLKLRGLLVNTAAK